MKKALRRSHLSAEPTLLSGFRAFGLSGALFLYKFLHDLLSTLALGNQKARVVDGN
jgi:hypothetical protein